MLPPTTSITAMADSCPHRLRLARGRSRRGRARGAPPPPLPHSRPPSPSSELPLTPPSVMSSLSPPRQATPPLRPRHPLSSNRVADVPEGALELGMLAGGLAPSAVEGGRGGARLTRSALPRLFSLNPAANFPKKRSRRTQRRGTHLHRIDGCCHWASEGSTAPTTKIKGQILSSFGRNKLGSLFCSFFGLE
jgi:hypothetical protein